MGTLILILAVGGALAVMVNDHSLDDDLRETPLQDFTDID